MSDYDNGFKRAQQMYDAQEQPEDGEPEDDKALDTPLRCPKCKGIMTEELDDYYGRIIYYCRNCHEGAGN